MQSDEELSQLESGLGYTFTTRALLERALTHSSVKMTNDTPDYERLEFLGDAVFALVVAELLHDRFPDAKEGDLTKLRSALVRKNTLADIGKELGLSSYIRTGKSEGRDAQLSQAPGILSDVVEALAGAVFLDSGYSSARAFIARLVEHRIDTVSVIDSKSELQELLQARRETQPVYKIEAIEGSQEAPQFIASCTVHGDIMGMGSGSSKKESEQAAAAQALKALKIKIENYNLENAPGDNAEMKS